MEPTRQDLQVRSTTWVTVILAVLIVGCRENGSQGSVVRDAGGNTYSSKRMRDGRTWVTDNLRPELPDSYCYDGMASQCVQLGRLYTWASAAEACRLLGAGWRLPTDDEWRRMARGYGGVLGDSHDEGRAAYMALLKGGDSGFDAVLGGDRESGGNYVRVDDHGFYWTATESDKGHAWFYNFGRGAGLLNRHSEGDKSMAISVRCIGA
jgi:uncharacterized protein (TIGR02145 family)